MGKAETTCLTLLGRTLRCFMSRNAIATVRELTQHRTNGANENIRIFVLDGPGHGGACHEYVILVPQDGHDAACSEHAWKSRTDSSVLNVYTRYRINSVTHGDGSCSGSDLHLGQLDAVVADWDSDNGPDDEKARFYVVTRIAFQNGPIKEFGSNGLTQEALFAIIIDRLEGFQTGKFSCRENAVALTHTDTALLWLKKRTFDRLARSVEGTTQQ
jgi:hypothetical protein